MWIWSLGWEGPLKEGTATHSSILAWRITGTEEPGKLLGSLLGCKESEMTEVTQHAYCSILPRAFKVHQAGVGPWSLSASLQIYLCTFFSFSIKLQAILSCLFLHKIFRIIVSSSQESYLVFWLVYQSNERNHTIRWTGNFSYKYLLTTTEDWSKKELASKKWTEL